MYDTGIPAAIDKAATEAKETVSQYIKKSIVMRLSKEGYIEKSVVTNRTEDKHKKTIQRLKEYIAAEESKLK